ncbi:hypothetical protein LTR53_014982 [Teratosphaeriaceae sp. CCFEE 6253]|nr:hypothetical protein LTR53_014982 [Teratosphaeriaceae sp. CCFEE 6253]
MGTALTHSSPSPFPFTSPHQASLHNDRHHHAKQASSWDWSALEVPERTSASANSNTITIDDEENEELGENIVVAHTCPRKATLVARKPSPVIRKAHPIFRREGMPRLRGREGQGAEVIVLDQEVGLAEKLGKRKRKDAEAETPRSPSSMKRVRIGGEQVTTAASSTSGDPAQGLISSVVGMVEKGGPAVSLSPWPTSNVETGWGRKSMATNDTITIDDSDDEQARSSPTARSMRPTTLKSSLSTPAFPATTPARPSALAAAPLYPQANTVCKESKSTVLSPTTGVRAPASASSPLRPRVADSLADPKPTTRPLSTDYDAKPVIPFTPRPQTGAASIDRKPAGPFMIDSDSDSDGESAPPPRPSSVVNAKSSLRHAGPTSTQKEAQRLLSEQLRREAVERRMGMPTSGTEGSSATVRLTSRTAAGLGAGAKVRRPEEGIERRMDVRPAGPSKVDSAPSVGAAKGRESGNVQAVSKANLEVLSAEKSVATARAPGHATAHITRVPQFKAHGRTAEDSTLARSVSDKGIPATPTSSKLVHDRNLTAGAASAIGAVRPKSIDTVTSRSGLEDDITGVKTHDVLTKSTEQAKLDEARRRQRAGQEAEHRKRAEAEIAQAKAANDAAKQAERARHAELVRQRAERNKGTQVAHADQGGVDLEKKQRKEAAQEAYIRMERQRLSLEAQDERDKLALEREKETEERQRLHNEEQDAKSSREALQRAARQVEDRRRAMEKEEEARRTRLREKDTATRKAAAAHGAAPATRAILGEGTDGIQARTSSDEHMHHGDVPRLHDDDAGDAHQERILAMQRRNARNREAGEQEMHSTEPGEGDVRRVPIPSETHEQHHREAPAKQASTASSRDAAGLVPQRFAQRTMELSAQASTAGASATSSADTASVMPTDAAHGDQFQSRGIDLQPFRAVTSRDVKLIQLKRAGLHWDEILPAYRHETGHLQSRHKLNERWIQLKQMLVSDGPLVPMLELDGEYAGVTLEQLRKWTRKVASHSQDKYTVTLGEVSAEDVQLLKWKHEGRTFDELVVLYQELTAIKRSTTAIRSRYKLLTAAFHGVKFDDQTLLDRVAGGDTAAKATLNEIVQREETATPASTIPHALDGGPARTKRKRTLGEVMPADIALMRWRDSGISWSHIPARFQEFTGESQSSDTLRKRHSQVKTAVDQHGVDGGLLDSVAAGDMHARQALNRLIHGTWPVPSVKSAGQRPQGPVSLSAQGGIAVARQTNGLLTPGGSFNASRDHSSVTLPRNERSERSFADGIEADLDDDEPGEDDPSGERPNTGGKTLTIAAMQHFHSNMLQVWAGDDDSEAIVDEEIDEQDLCHFAYQVQRREILQTEVDEGGHNLDELPWVDCGRPGTNIERANKLALRQLAVTHTLHLKVAMARSGKLERDLDDRGLVYGTHHMSGAGAVEVRVARGMRTFTDGIQLDADDACLPRRIYFVRVRVWRAERPAEGDETDAELFGGDDDEAQRKLVSQFDLHNAAYSVLELANGQAVEHFLSKAWCSTSMNLDQRSLEKAQMREQMLSELEGEGGDGLFKRSAEVDGDGDELEIAVEEGEIRGPRNF